MLRKDLRDLKTYIPPKTLYKIKLDANESPYDIPREIKQRIWEKAQKEKFNYYCDPQCTQLKDLLSTYTGFRPEEIFVGNGGDEIIFYINLAFGGPGGEVIIPTPTFSSYEISATISGAKVIKVPLIQEDTFWDLDIEEIRSHFRKNSNQIIFLCYPNNPTGNYFGLEKILDIFENFTGIVAIDEAYFGFGQKSLAEKILEYPNTIIIRTLSKLFCIAGLRVGYALGNKNIIEQLNKVKMPYNVNVFSQIAAIEVLKSPQWIRRIQSKIVKSREELYERLKNISGIKPYPSFTNFILCDVEKRNRIYNNLLSKGISVRKFDDEGLENSLRFSIGTSEQNELLVSTLIDSTKEIY